MLQIPFTALDSHQTQMQPVNDAVDVAPSQLQTLDQAHDLFFVLLNLVFLGQLIIKTHVLPEERGLYLLIDFV